VKNIFWKLFSSTKREEWNKNHILYCSKYLELNDNGYSLFQTKLLDELENVLTDFRISYVTEITEHRDLNDKYKDVKMITLTLDDNSKFWIYHDMAEFDLRNEHQIYEEWGYLKPQDLMDKYLDSVKDRLKIESNEL
jgi:hypothetical protein